MGLILLFRQLKSRSMPILLKSVLVIWAAMALSACESGLNGFIYKQAIPTDYFEPFTEQPSKFIQHTDRVYSFSLGMNRAMVLKTNDGIAVFDSFNRHFSEALANELAVQFPNTPVRWLAYSHNHLDHTRGGAYLKPEHVIGHKDVNPIFADWAHPENDMLAVTQPIHDDTTLTLGGVEVQFLYMPHSHSTTLYGIYIPSEQAVFAADMMFVKAMPPYGLPDWYYPGYIRALDRLIALNAATYIPSHFDLGTRQDLIDYRNMMVDYRDVVVNEMAKLAFEPEGGDRIKAIFDVAYPKLKEKYGDWHGFEAMFLPHFSSSVGATYLGF